MFRTALASCLMSLAIAGQTSAEPASTVVVSTGQDRCYDDQGTVIDCIDGANGAFPRQDGPSRGRPAAYLRNRDGTVSDLVTGLMWAEAPSPPLPFDQTDEFATASRLGGYSDWRVPSIHELYSLIDFRGSFDGSPETSRPYIDTSAFVFAYGTGSGLGDATQGQRPIDVQEWSSSEYSGLTAGRDRTVFGVNFADGRIKGYPVMDPATRMQTQHLLPVRLVRGQAYGVAELERSGDVVTDRSSGLSWTQHISGEAFTWGEALKYCAASRVDGNEDWRLPTAKELNLIVDYQRIPAISPLFQLDDPGAYLWSSTTHLESPPPLDTRDAPFDKEGMLAVYAAIGPALGKVEIPPGSGDREWVDIHGAGAMRSDPKTPPQNSFPDGFGPQGDDVRSKNQVICVREMKSR